MKVQYFNGVHFTRDDKTGYYLNSTIGERIHRYVWKYYNGEIPGGYEVHHIDHDKSNNEISNLKILHKKEHLSYHGKIQGYKNVESGHLDNIRELAKDWHASEAGREWHKKHYEETKEKLHSKKEFVCQQCGSSFIAEVTGVNRFCSNKCKSKWRRDSGVDDEKRTCEQCGKPFSVNKYSKTRTCSRSCGAKGKSKESKSKDG